MTQPLYQASAFDPAEIRRWGKVMILVALLAAFLMALKPIRSPDVWHHIASGRYVAETGGPARTDPFSCTAQGKRWIQYEWLAQFLIYQAFDKTGVPGLVLFRALLVCVAAALLISTVRARHRAAWAASAVAVTVALLAASPRFFSRPEIFTFVLFSAWRLCGELIRRGRLRYMFLPPLFMALWVNMHGAWPAGLAWLGLIAGGETVMLYLRPQYSTGKKRAVKALWITLLAGVLATFLNPYGWHIWEVPLMLARSPEVATFIAEWKPPDLAHWLSAPHLGVWLFFAVIILSPRTITLGDALVIGFFGFMTLTARRHLALTMMILAPIAATQMSLIWRRYRARFTTLRRYGHWRFAVAAVICLALVPVAYGGSLGQIGVGVDHRYIPAGSCDFLAKNNLDGNLFNNYEFGNYLIFARYPHNRVFIDGRVDMYGMKIVLLYDAVRSGKFWQEAFGQFDIHLCVLSTDGSGEKELISILHERPDWALVFWDDNSCVYVERSPEHEEFLKNTYIYTVRPDEFDPALLDDRASQISAERDYLRKLEEEPENVVAIYGLAKCRAARGERESAVGLLKNAIGLAPRNATLHYTLGTVLLEMGRQDEAEQSLKQTLALKELLPETYTALGVLHSQRGDTKAAIRALEKARDLNPGHWRARWNLSVLYEEQGRMADALNEAREAVRLEPAIPGAQQRIIGLQNKTSGSHP